MRGGRDLAAVFDQVERRGHEDVGREGGNLRDGYVVVDGFPVLFEDRRAVGVLAHDGDRALRLAFRERLHGFAAFGAAAGKAEFVRVVLDRFNGRAGAGRLVRGLRLGAGAAAFGLLALGGALLAALFASFGPGFAGFAFFFGMAVAAFRAGFGGGFFAGFGPFFAHRRLRFALQAGGFRRGRRAFFAGELAAASKQLREFGAQRVAGLRSVELSAGGRLGAALDQLAFAGRALAQEVR